MQFFIHNFRRYAQLDRSVRNAIAAQFFVQSINTSFFLLLNYYMTDEGYADYRIADVLSYRFLSVFCLAFPLGLLIKGRRLRPFFLISTALLPIFSFLIIWSVGQHYDQLLDFAAMIWGAAYMCMQITILPYILLNAKPSHHSEAIALSFVSFSVTICLVGISHALLTWILPGLISEESTLKGVAGLAFLGVYFAYRVSPQEKLTEKVPLRKIAADYDWGLIFRAVIPTIIIAIGAGFTIPVINLFFYHIHGIPAEVFSIMGSATFLLVAMVMIFMPVIRRNFGYTVAITGFQSVAVLLLLGLATTEWYREWEFAAVAAALFYIFRQPLMNAAGPMTSELVMYYVGPRNQEIIAALNASIWSGSWFVSTSLFSMLRRMEFRYVSIFLITVIFYVIGIVWYARLIRSYRIRTGKTGKA
ncbi:MFS transporter [Flavilitoribacter nigricans]|uniref:MFS transporter n=1 Tax=Flavilitoribacter nigricans (strain ATCC 23147 / DSM 23189 / NBRC 102662 / NCIMB 1420 / SS-2) TaxID=1122177 RepID=A0A2D0NJA1_FLAN2|nr:MFS transporter [Flavilitoribacter nigricans]PHN08518.1 hypothetical protein CRP01_00990 [Flavilitoribacter nigricans DSM 23189 = NBRC 102662]